MLLETIYFLQNLSWLLKCFCSCVIMTYSVLISQRRQITLKNCYNQNVAKNSISINDFYLPTLYFQSYFARETKSPRFYQSCFLQSEAALHPTYLKTFIKLTNDVVERQFLYYTKSIQYIRWCLPEKAFVRMVARSEFSMFNVSKCFKPRNVYLKHASICIMVNDSSTILDKINAGF